ncbi:MAG: hypothetical protein EBX65_01890, partial [Betaproteobacteria bacterium]|nr:hypothetical protein [Betaproteobacteria bacterium]
HRPSDSVARSSFKRR